METTQRLPKQRNALLVAIATAAAFLGYDSSNCKHMPEKREAKEGGDDIKCYNDYAYDKMMMKMRSKEALDSEYKQQ